MNVVVGLATWDDATQLARAEAFVAPEALVPLRPASMAVEASLT